MKKKNIALAVGGALGSLVAWKFLTRAGEVVWADVSGAVAHAENSRFAEVDGATIHYQEFGEANNPTVILIHGYTASAYVWNAAAPLLAAENLRVVAVDLLGFGYSEKPASFDYTIASQARMISRFMNRLGIGRAALVGSSYGGAVAATLALDYAERVEKLVLVDAVINDDLKNAPIFRLAAVPVLGETVAPFLLDSKRFFRRRMRSTIAPENHRIITQERVDSVARPLRAADAHRSVLRTARAWDANRVERDAQFIKQPTLIVWGAGDRVIPVRDGEKLRDAILHSRLVVFKNCGHVPQEEAPEEFARAVADFCRAPKTRIESARV